MFLLLFISQPMGSIKWAECQKADCNVTTEDTSNKSVIVSVENTCPHETQLQLEEVKVYSFTLVS